MTKLGLKILRREKAVPGEGRRTGGGSVRLMGGYTHTRHQATPLPPHEDEESPIVCHSFNH